MEQALRSFDLRTLFAVVVFLVRGKLLVVWKWKTLKICVVSEIIIFEIKYSGLTKRLSCNCVNRYYLIFNVRVLISENEASENKR